MVRAPLRLCLNFITLKELTPKTREDLELAEVLRQVAQYAVTDAGKERVVALHGYKSENLLVFQLRCVQEYMESYGQDNAIPNHGFDPVYKDLKMLEIEDSTLEQDAFRRLAGISESLNLHIKFFRKFGEFYPRLSARLHDFEIDEDVPRQVNSVFNRFGEVKDDASPDLKNVRREIKTVQGGINGAFGRALSRYSASGYLDDIRESVVDSRRVLAVKAAYRRKVKGTILGNSKTGSITFVEPEESFVLSRKLTNLQFEEREEIKRILRKLTMLIRPKAGVLWEQRGYLVETDTIHARARYAHSIDARLPNLNHNKSLHLDKAYHPLLLVSNRKKDLPVYPQTIKLDKDNRILVISGPNAGGKSLTLKTVGLLQLMLQTGLLVPVSNKSSMCLFQTILTDIGDNQSIENQLSTYSYRLKNMRKFLRKCDEHTLFLIDEFGTGSDPELGGALAEAMLEELYERGSYGIITTHYTNLKMLASQTDGMGNANMLFDSTTLEPRYKLHVGEAGSSFTFEVAQKNGIPWSIINRAKKKVERGKIRYDESIAALQKERSKLRKTTDNLSAKSKKASSYAEELEDKKGRIQKKLEDFQTLYDSNQRYIGIGKKLDNAAAAFMNHKNKKRLQSELMKIIAVENSKRAAKKPKQVKQEKQLEKKVENEAMQKVTQIRTKKRVEKLKQQVATPPPPPVAVGDRVRITDSKSIGTLVKIERGKGIVNYGLFKTQVSLEQLELVEKTKAKV